MAESRIGGAPIMAMIAWHTSYSMVSKNWFVNGEGNKEGIVAVGLFQVEGEI